MNGRQWTGIVLAALVLTSCRTDGPQPNAEAGGGQDQSAGVAITPTVPSRRLVYPWSVVSGGVDSPLAMRRAIQEDPVVEAHYAGLNPAEFRAEILPAKRQGYVSYRLRDKIYWTRGMVTLLAGETVLSDGRFQVRGRCGNLISPTPRMPVAPVGIEPAEIAMDLAVREAQLMHSPSLPSEMTVETEKVLNPKQIGTDREMTSVLPMPDPQEMMPPLWTAGGTSSQGAGIVGSGGGSGTPQSSPDLTPASPAETPKPNPSLVPVLTRPAPIEFPQPMVIASLIPPLATPNLPVSPITPNFVWEHRPPRSYPPGVTPMPPRVPPQVYYPPGENPPPTNTPPSSPPPFPSPSPPPPPSFDPPSSPPPGPPPPDMPVPEPGGWVLLVLGLSGIAARFIRRNS